MRVIIEIDSDDELRRLKHLLGEERIEVRTSRARTDASDRAARRERLRALQQRIRITLPDDYHFDRDTLYDRHG